MRHGRPAALAATLAALAFAAPATATPDSSVYGLANGCYELSPSTGLGPFRMKATALGSFLLYTKDGKYLTHSGSAFSAADAPGPDSDFAVDGSAASATLTLAGQKLPGTFAFTKAAGCAQFPESEVDVSGAPSKPATPWGWVGGLLDAHMHWM